MRVVQKYDLNYRLFKNRLFGLFMLGWGLWSSPQMSAPCALAEDEPIEVQMDHKLDEWFESKQTRYKREQREADELKKRQEELDRQQQNLDSERRMLDRQQPRQPAPEQSGAVTPQLPPNAVDPALAKKVKVDLFVASDCPDCERMERYLNELGVPYERKVLTSGTAVERDYLQTVGRGILPVIRVNGKTLRGFEPEETRRLIMESRGANR